MSEEPLLASEGGDHKSFSSSFRRCSILGPPSLFPSQKTSDAGGPQELSTSGSRPGTTNTTNTNTRDQVSEEITLAIADLDFYYGLGMYY